ncbi:MAG: T9SS type A sorting domain-containing protein [Salibacteraceae bacterium]
MRVSLFLLISTLCTSTLFAQSNLGYRIDQSIEVRQNGVPLVTPFAGGFSAPQFSAIDLDGDGTMDLVSFDRQGNIAKPFLYQGSPHQSTYKFAPEFLGSFPFMDRFALFRDYNCDGKTDLFTYYLGGFRVWQNTSSNGQLSFALAYDRLKADFGTSSSPIYTLAIDIPAIVDVDQDGDLDILAFGPGGGDGNVYYYRNLREEDGLPCDSLRYELADACWGKFREDPINNGILMNQMCKGGHDRDGERHSGSTLLMLDQDGDQDMELVLGDISFNNLVSLTNGGDLTSATITSFSTNYPGTTPVDMPIFPAGYHLDIDQDGNRDLLVAPNTGNGSFDTSNVWWYRNEGLDALPDFQLQGKRWLSNEMIELGTGSNPVFFDENADGKLDLLVGNFGYWQPSGTPVSQLALFRNTGSLLQPSFELITHDYLNLSSLAMRGLHPTFGDLDGDGDEDLLLGDQEGKLIYYENVATSGQVANLVLNSGNYASIDVGLTAAPQLVDVDRDGLLDLLIGERSGKIHYFHNTGTAAQAQFSDVPDSDFFGGIDTQIPCCTGYAAPYLTELDSSGQYYLTVGAENGNIYVYDQVEGNLTGNFRLIDSLVTYNHRVRIAFGQLIQDAPPELVIGSLAGGLQVLHKEFDVPINVTENVPLINEVAVFPNPSETTVQLRFLATGVVDWSLTDLLGRSWQQGHFTPDQGTSAQIDLSHLSAGVYLLRLQVGEDQQTVKLIRR